MWTNQGKQYLANYIFNKSDASTRQFKTMNDLLSNKNDWNASGQDNSSPKISATMYNGTKNPDGSTYYSSATSGTPTLYVGTGTTEPTADDYGLEALVPMTMVGTANVYGGGTVTTISIPLQNTSGTAQTITEICLAVLANDDSGSAVASSKTTAIMLNRKLLPEPVEMGVNDVYVFTFELDWANLTD